MKVAVIGCGTIANNAHIPSYMANPKAEIKYFCDIDLAKAQKAVEQYGCGIAVADYKEVLADEEIVAVSVCTPNLMHSKIAIDAMKAGKHVLCEKPAARVYEEALEMQQVQHETGKILNIGVVNRFNTNVNKLKELIDQGELGDIYQVYVSFRNGRCIPGLGGAFTTKDIAGGGVMIDWGVHFFDIVMYCCGDPKTKSVSAETFSKLGSPIKDYTYVGMWAGPEIPDGTYDVEEGVTGVIRTEGPTITFNGAWAQNVFVDEMYIDFMGTKGGARLQYGQNFTLYSTKNGMLTTTTFANKEKPMFQEEIDAFVDCIESGEKLVSHIDTNIITAQMMDAIYRSAEEHREVIVKYGAKDWHLEAWATDGGLVKDGDILVIEGIFAGNGVSFYVDRTYVKYASGLVFFADNLSDLDKGAEVLSAGYMEEHAKGYEQGSFYFSLPANSKIPYSSDWSVRYKPVNDGTILRIRNGVTKDVTNTEAETLVKYGATDWYLESWATGGGLTQDGDILVVEGTFAGNDVSFKIEKTYIMYYAGMLTFSKTMPKVPNGIEAIAAGTMTEHPNGYNAGSFYFTLPANSEIPYNSDWSVRYKPMGEGVILRIRNGETKDVTNVAAETLVKYGETDWHLEGWATDGGLVQEGDVLVVEGVFVGKDVFNEIEEAGYKRHNYGMLPIPHATADKIGQEDTNIAMSNSYGFVASNSEHKDLAMEFMRFLHTDEQLSAFTAETNMTRGLNYEILAEDAANLTTYAQAILKIKEETNVIYPYSSIEQVISNGIMFANFGWAWLSNVDGYEFKNPFLYFRDTEGANGGVV